MPTTVTKAIETSALAASLSPIETTAQLDRMALMKEQTDLVAWFEADSLYATSGSAAGWRDRVSGLLFPQLDNAKPYPTLATASDFNSKSVLQWASSNASVFTDGGANDFPVGNVDHTIIVVGKGSSGNNDIFASDGGSLGAGTLVYTGSSGGLNYIVGGQSMGSISSGVIGVTTPFISISSFKYAASSLSQFAARANRGAGTLTKTSGITGAPAGSKLTLGGYNVSGTTATFAASATIAAVMIFKGAILHGNYATTTYSNFSNETLSQIIEDYFHTKYGV